MVDPGAPALAILAYLPSPSRNTIGPLHFYGLMIALGVYAAVQISVHRWRARGGDPDDIWSIALWCVPAGLIGARIYHVVTDWKTYFPHNIVGVLKIQEGGLGIPGGIILGLIVGVLVTRRRGIRTPSALDAVAPAIPVAQAIGRLGNWFNQELFGRPTTLPWGLKIDALHRPAGYLQYATYQPTFAYEALLNLVLAGLLVLLDRRRIVRPGRLFVLYIGGYAAVRFLVESLRFDHASLILGIRVNLWTSAITFVGVVLFLAVKGLRRRPGDDDHPYLDGHRFDEPDRTAAVSAGPADPADPIDPADPADPADPTDPVSA